ncbi:MAG TPA: TonB-dependent receptor, partial [Xanthomarina gelatinilytica]|nr:TonB-dependent receptor [Xanthomarina gelatinilytica]
FQYSNSIGSYRVTGLDFLINKQFKHISTWLGYSFSKNHYSFTNLNQGEKFPNNVDIRHQLNASGTYTINRLKLALGFNWHTGKPTTFIDVSASEATNSLIYGQPNANNVSDYWRTDISAVYDILISKHTKAQVGASFWNIFNTKNIINSYYVMDANDQVIHVENVSLGFTPNVSLRVIF